MPEWQHICAELWGDDWIAPLSEILRVNRRTVERWKSGAIDIPSAVIRDLERVYRRVGGYARQYGETLRKIAGGQTVEDLQDSISQQKRALNRFEADLQKLDPVAVLAAGPVE